MVFAPAAWAVVVGVAPAFIRTSAHSVCGIAVAASQARLRILAFWAVWILAAQFLDLFYIIMPTEWLNHKPAGVDLKDLASSRFDVYQISPALADFTHRITFPLSPMGLLITLSCFIGMAGIYVAFTMAMLRRHAVVPLKDPRLHESLVFENM